MAETTHISPIKRPSGPEISVTFVSSGISLFLIFFYFCKKKWIHLNFYLRYLRKTQNKKRRKRHLFEAGIHREEKNTLFFQCHQETKLSL